MYVCSIPNPRQPGHIKELISDDAALIDSFVAAEDRPGVGVYYCPNTLMAGATKRCLETVGQINRIWVDIDFKDIDEDPVEAERRLRQLPIQPTVIRSSGGGYHVLFDLHEPIARGDPDFARASDLYKRVAHILCGDPAPAHPSALLRYPGTRNTKRSDPVICEDRFASDGKYDLADLEAMIDLLGAPIFTCKEKPRANGHDTSASESASGPVDVEARFASMGFKALGSDAIHTTQLQCSASLLRAGQTVDSVVEEVIQTTRAATAGDERCTD